MENLHEQIKAYIPKLEYSIREYMRNPATPNAAQGIMAMVECLNMLKGAEISIHAPRAGRDGVYELSSHLDTNFNPRAPCGARRCQ